MILFIHPVEILSTHKTEFPSYGQLRDKACEPRSANHCSNLLFVMCSQLEENWLKGNRK